MKKTENNKKGRVVVGMSGGVDSSVAAAVLKEQGYEVVGVFMHFWSDSAKATSDKTGRENACCSLESQEEARKVARILDIPFYTVNVEKEFKKEVVDYFIREYEAGRTPNPCIRCNQHIKFKVLFKKMMEMEADFVATGHYARVVREGYKLISSRDKDKDQSYFLYTLTQEQLAQVLFPIGEFENKEAVRKMAKKLKLPVFAKKDSQDICFVFDSTNEFLKRHIKVKPGNIVEADGNILGKHQGLPLYTLGQRKGINIGGNGPYFVTAKNARKNELVVANEIEASMEASIEEINWIQKPAKFPSEVMVRTRYRNPLVRATILEESRITNHESWKIWKVVFNKPQRALTPGQAAVFYSTSGEVVGGGMIADVL